MKFRGYGLQLSELVSEGNLGLIQSLERFDPKKGLDFQPMLCGGLEHQSRIYFTLLVTRKNWNNSSTKKTILQFKITQRKTKSIR